MFVDTHCHLTMMVKKKVNELLSPQQLEQIGVLVDESMQEEVAQIITVATTLIDSNNAIEVAKTYTNVHATVGIHPCDCGTGWKNEFLQVKGLLRENREVIVALGETGLDFYHKPFFKQRQIDAFKMHIDCAIEYDLPVIVHIRESEQEVLKVLEEYKGQVRGVAHCFVQSKDIADVLLDWGFCLGIGGPISYPKNDYLRNMYKMISLEKIVLETDAPFLPPQQYRGKKNHPKYIPLIAQVLADSKDVDIKKVENSTTRNAKQLFDI